jgi:hyperosmotically inducible periplasmic protein
VGNERGVFYDTKMMRGMTVAWMLLVSTAAVGCSSTIGAAALRDAQLGASVKTALVNDPQLGPIPIEVRVSGGVVHLTGRVSSDAERQRAISLAKTVPGVDDVIADLRVGPADLSPPAPPQQGALVTGEEREPHLLSVGVSVGRSAPSEDGFDDSLRIGPLVRFGTGRGLGPAIGFGWFRAAWRGSTPDARVTGEIRVRPVLGGIAYGVQGDRKAVSFSLLGGIAFNSVALPRAIEDGEIPLSIAHSLALRPGASMWLDIDRRFAVNIAVNYLMTRPRARVLERGEVRTRSLRADAILINTGVVYKIF